MHYARMVESRAMLNPSGPLHTPMLMDFLNTPEKLNRRLVHSPMGRFGEAIEQAMAVVFRESSAA
jgi:hypothetical protein